MRTYELVLKKLAVLILSFLLFSCGSETEKNQLDEVKDTLNEVKRDTAPQINPYKDSKIEVVTYDNKAAGNSMSGFGYDIQIDGKMYVHQPHIPAVPGNNGFSTAEKAKIAGELVAYKIRNNIMPPSVTEKELDSLGVLK